jgi:hypothetical protein
MISYYNLFSTFTLHIQYITDIFIRYLLALQNIVIQCTFKYIVCLCSKLVNKIQ